MTGPGWTCYACGEWISSETSHACGTPNTETWHVLYAEPRFEKCPACGLEWRRGRVKNCPYCSLTFAGYNKVQAERDQARDWCRMLVALIRAWRSTGGWIGVLCNDATCQRVACKRWRALPPELRAAIGE